jgi:predicted aminopeptidase
MTKLWYYPAGVIIGRPRRQSERRRYSVMKMKKWIACLICVAFLAGCASMNQTTDPASRSVDDKKEVDMTVRP